jgi:hypothetical protein
MMARKDKYHRREFNDRKIAAGELRLRIAYRDGTEIKRSVYYLNLIPDDIRVLTMNNPANFKQAFVEKWSPGYRKWVTEKLYTEIPEKEKR